MGIITQESEIYGTICPEKLLKAFVLEPDTVIPKVMPQFIKSMTILEGDAGPGTIKQLAISVGHGVQYVKERADAMDKENYSYAYTVIEGPSLANIYEKIAKELKFFRNSDGGGSICKSISKYYTINEDLEVKEEEVKADKEKARGIFRLVEAYLLAYQDD